MTKFKLKEVYVKEQKGPVTAITHVVGFLVTAVGQKVFERVHRLNVGILIIFLQIYLWQLKDNDLIGVAFIDTNIYVHQMVSIKSLILVADVYKSISLLRFQARKKYIFLKHFFLRTSRNNSLGGVSNVVAGVTRLQLLKCAEH